MGKVVNRQPVKFLTETLTAIVNARKNFMFLCVLATVDLPFARSDHAVTQGMAASEVLDTCDEYPHCSGKVRKRGAVLQEFDFTMMGALLFVASLVGWHLVVRPSSVIVCKTHANSIFPYTGNVLVIITCSAT